MATPHITADQLKGMSPAAIAELINTLAAAKEAPIKFKVSEKGALSVYGLNARFPVTLYIGQWERLWNNLDAFKTFAKENNGKLTRKV